MWSFLGLTHIVTNESAPVHCGTLFCLNTLLAFTVLSHSRKEKGTSLIPKAQIYRKCAGKNYPFVNVFSSLAIQKS